MIALKTAYSRPIRGAKSLCSFQACKKSPIHKWHVITEHLSNTFSTTAILVLQNFSTKMHSNSKCIGKDTNFTLDWLDILVPRCCIELIKVLTPYLSSKTSDLAHCVSPGIPEMTWVIGQNSHLICSCICLSCSCNCNSFLSLSSSESASESIPVPTKLSSGILANRISNTS